MENISDNNNLQVLKLLPLLFYGKRIEKSLGGVFVGPVSSIDYMGTAKRADKFRGSRSCMAYNNSIGIHRLQIQYRVFERFSFGYTASLFTEINDIST